MAQKIEIKRQQRRILCVGLIVAAVPIGCQFLMLLALAAAPGAFPAADRTFLDLRFWPVQIVLLCVAVSGNAIVDCVRVFWLTGRAPRAALNLLLSLILVFFTESLMFSVTLLAAPINWWWLIAMTMLGAVNLTLAYMLEMEIAGEA